VSVIPSTFDQSRGPNGSPRKLHVPPVVVWIGVIVLLVIGFLVAWNNGLRNMTFPKAFRVVEPGKIFASGVIYHGLIEKTITQHHIQRVIALTDDPGNVDEQAERDVSAKLGVKYFLFPLNGDGTGDIHQYEKTLIEVNRAVGDNAPVLVHCFAGAQRTRGWIAFYRLLVQQHSPAEVKAELTTRDWRAPPSPKLFPYVNEHMAELAQLLVADGVIKSVPNPIPQIAP
jgi:predicted protein tyrosine phosphatase